MGSFSDDELITQLEKLLHKLQDIADNTDAGIMETAVSFKRDPNSSILMQLRKSHQSLNTTVIVLK